MLLVDGQQLLVLVFAAEDAVGEVADLDIVKMFVDCVQNNGGLWLLELFCQLD